MGDIIKKNGQEDGEKMSKEGGMARDGNKNQEEKIYYLTTTYRRSLYPLTPPPFLSWSLRNIFNFTIA